jgi:hypothetical protein
MELKVTNYLTIKLSEPKELIELISDEDKIEFMQSLSCEDIIIKHVSDQIIHGCTELGYYGYKGCTGSSPSTPLDIAIRQVSKCASTIAKKQIESLERALKYQEDETTKYQDKYYKLYNNL